MTTSLYPTSADNIPAAGDPGITPSLLADAVNAIQADLIAIGETSTLKAAKVVTSTLAFASGTGVTNLSGTAKTYSVNTTTAGSVVVSLAPVGSSTYTSYQSKTLAATDCVSVLVPAGFSVKFTLTTSTPVAAFWTIL